MRHGHIRRILCIKTGALGDVTMTTPALRKVREAFPQAHIAYLVGRQSHEVLLNNPHLDELITFDDKVFIDRKYSDFIRLLLTLRKRHFDMTIAFHVNSLIHLMSRLMGAGHRAAFARGDRAWFLTHKLDISGKENWNPCRLNLELLKTIGVDTGAAGGMELYLSRKEEEYAATFASEKVRGRRPVIGLFPGGGKNAATDFIHKRWGMQNFNALIASLMRQYPDCCIIVFGAGAEGHLSEDLAKAAAVIDLIGQTSVREMVALMSMLNLVVTNDSSPMHFATALGIPTVSLFGPTSARKYAHQGDSHKSISSTAACSPCEDSRGRYTAHCMTNECMNTIQPGAVFELSRTLLDRT